MRSKESIDRVSDLASDINPYHRERFARITNEHAMKDTVDNDDIFFCSDIDRERREAYRSQLPAQKASIIQQPHSTMQAAGMPGADPSKFSRVSPFSAKKISMTSGGDNSGTGHK